MEEITLPNTTEPAQSVTQDALPTGTPESDTHHTTWRVPLVQIHPFERNPRLSPNPEYDRIKDSIRQNGLDQPLVITRRPGAGDYIVHSGGNTRLKVLKELFAESGDPRYAEVPCLFRSWRSESAVLLAHLRENDIRGSLSFIDKARAVMAARQLFQEERGLKEISLRMLESELAKLGYRLSNPAICLMAYAVETLLPLVPQALESGMGARQIRRIRALERAGSRLWQRYCEDDEQAFDAVFATLCRRYDGWAWDTEVLQGAIETEIAESSETSIQTIRVAFDAELEGRTLSIPEFIPIKAPPDPQSQAAGNEAPKLTDGTDEEAGGMEEPEADVGNLLPPDKENQDPAAAEIPAGDVLTDTSRNELDTLDALTDAAPDAVDALLNSAPSAPDDLNSLRDRAWKLAMRLAQRNGLGELVVALPHKGLGFLLRDVPDPTLADQLDEQSLAQLNLLWWQLAACAEITHAPLEAILSALPGHSLLRRALQTEDAGLLFEHIWTLDPGHTGYWLWYALHERDWRDLICLMATYRRLRQLAAETGTALWG